MRNTLSRNTLFIKNFTCGCCPDLTNRWNRIGNLPDQSKPLSSYSHSLPEPTWCASFFCPSISVSLFFFPSFSCSTLVSTLQALACFMLRLLPEYKNATIVRTRDPAVLATCNIVVDVGGVYDPATHRYDHHQVIAVSIFVYQFIS